MFLTRSIWVWALHQNLWQGILAVATRVSVGGLRIDRMILARDGALSREQ